MTHIGVLLVVGLALRVVGAIPVVFAVLPVPSYISKDASCLSYSQTGCAEAAAASYALDCVTDDPTGNDADDRDWRTIYLPGSVTQAAPLTLEITSCDYMYTQSATAAMNPYQSDPDQSITVSSGVTVTVWGSASIRVYRPGCVPPRGDHAPSCTFTHFLEPLLLRRVWLQVVLCASSLAVATSAAAAAALAALAAAVAASAAIAAVAAAQPAAAAVVAPSSVHRADGVRRLAERDAVTG